MKKTRLALFAAAALALVACTKEVQGEMTGTPDLGENTLAFTIKSGIATRSGETNAPSAGATFDLGTTPSGDAITLEETVTSLDGFYPELNTSNAPETRGTPVYSENFPEMSGSAFKGLAFPMGTLNNVGMNNAANNFKDGEFVYDNYFQKWLRTFDNDPWGTNEQMLFFGRMLKEDTVPSHASQPIGVIFTSYRFLNDSEGQRMTFSYRSPLTAQEQQDILFAVRTINKADAQKGSDLLFYHALTGVKFATAHENDGETKTFIDKVEFTGLYGYGKCTVKSITEGNGYTDIKDNYSSATAIQWEPSENGVNTFATVYSQEFSETPVDYAKGGSFGEKGKYADSFAAGGNENNLNAADGSMTFWMVPQAMTDNVKLKVTFRIQSGDVISEPITREIDFGKELNEKNGKTIVWKAGELRTYTLKAGEVDITITDRVENHIKSDIVISNVGNVPQFVRAQIVAEWQGKDGSGEEGTVMGYLSADMSDDNYITPWALVIGADGTITTDNYGGTFEGLPGTDWIRATDGYFYYTQPVALNSTTSTFFTSYTLNQANVPVVYYLDYKSYTRKPFTDVKLVMDIPVQAIEAKTGQSYTEAWAEAGVTVTPAQ